MRSRIRRLLLPSTRISWIAIVFALHLMPTSASLYARGRFADQQYEQGYDDDGGGPSRWLLALTITNGSPTTSLRGV